MNILAMDPTILDAWLHQAQRSPCWKCNGDCQQCAIVRDDEAAEDWRENQERRHQAQAGVL